LVLRTLENLGELLWAFADTIYTAVVNTLEDIGIDVPKHLETLQGAFETAFNALAGFVQPAVDAVVALWDKIIEFKGWLEGLEVPNPFEGWGADQTAPPGTTEPPAGAGPGRWVTNPANGTQIWLEDQSGQSSGGQGMRMPVMDTLPVMGGGAGAGGVTVHLGGVVINNGMDLAEFEWRLKQALRKAGR
jgi:hypothetical protein